MLLTAGLAGLVLTWLWAVIDWQGRDRWARPLYVFGSNALLAFLGSCSFVLGLLAATAAAVYPTMIRGTSAAASLTALNSAAGEHSLRAGLFWWPAGFLLAVLYYVVLFRLHRNRAQAAEEGEGY